MYGYNMAQSISHNQPLWCCDYSPDGRMVAAAGTGKCIFIYDTGPPPKDMELKLRIQGKYCIFEETRTGAFKVYDVSTTYLLYSLYILPKIRRPFIEHCWMQIFT